MAQLYFYYSAMNAGKSTSLLQSAYNYRERGMEVLVMTAGLDDRYGVGKVTSRIGLSSDALIYRRQDDLLAMVQERNEQQPVNCLLVDECQFLTKEQVRQLTYLVDKMDIPVLCYGLRTDFQGELFEGSHYLLAWADKLVELKTICHCGRKANMVVRMDGEGKPVRSGDQVHIGGNDSYVSMCRTHYRELAWD
ncbi:thymidine kinase [Ferrimonas sp.]|uniref:thymidine kinase n=1 Tax=Ferrimonas sp. TaxID=2080861 RepID=UPI003A8C977B